MRKFSNQFTIFSAKATTGTGVALKATDWQNILITLSSQSSANFTIKFQGSQSETCPDFSAAQSATNEWDYIQVKDYQNNAAIDGDTGVAFAGTDDVRMFEFNTNGLTWVSATITARSAGSVNCKFKGFSTT
jgi:hypothetical protein